MGLGRSRDQRIADQTHEDSGLMCGAHGCPNRWSVDAGNGRLCSAHAWVEPGDWPRVTGEQQHAAAQRAFEATNRTPKPPAPPLTRGQKAEILLKLRGLYARKGEPA